MMRCVRCGNEVPEGTKICKNCGFDFVEYSKYQKITIKEDPIVPDHQKSGLVDNPILAFIFGLITLIITFLFITASTLVLIYIFGIIAFSFLTFMMANRPSKVKLIPVKNVGKWMVYFAISLIVFKIVYQILGKLFF